MCGKAAEAESRTSQGRAVCATAHHGFVSLPRCPPVLGMSPNSSHKRSVPRAAGLGGAAGFCSASGRLPPLLSASKRQSLCCGHWGGTVLRGCWRVANAAPNCRNLHLAIPSPLRLQGSSFIYLSSRGVFSLRAACSSNKGAPLVPLLLPPENISYLRSSPVKGTDKHGCPESRERQHSRAAWMASLPASA